MIGVQGRSRRMNLQNRTREPVAAYNGVWIAK